jgi:hypothetical protein
MNMYGEHTQNSLAPLGKQVLPICEQVIPRLVSDGRFRKTFLRVDTSWTKSLKMAQFEWLRLRN